MNATQNTPATTQVMTRPQMLSTLNDVFADHIDTLRIQRDELLADSYSVYQNGKNTARNFNAWTERDDNIKQQYEYSKNEIYAKLTAIAEAIPMP